MPAAGRIATVAVLAAVACKSTIDADQVERAIAAFFTDELGPVARVDCPVDVEARPGASFTCTIVFAHSAPLTVLATHDDRGNGGFTLDQPVVANRQMAPRIAAWLKDRTGVVATVDCGPGVYAVADKGHPCTATATDGTRTTIVVRRAGGELTWDVGSP
jgi:hypothetical protein